MGHDDPRLRRHWLHGLSAEVKASIDGRLILRSSGLNCGGRLRAAFSLATSVGRLPKLADFVVKVGCGRWVGGHPVNVGGFDPPTLAALGNFDATQCTEPEREAVVRPAPRTFVGSERWQPEQTRPVRLVDHAVGADRASGCASSVRTASRSSCVPALIGRRPRSQRRTGQYPERLRADRVESCETEPSDSTAL